MTKVPIPFENESQEKHRVAINIVYYTTIADRLRTVGWSNFCHQIGVITQRLRNDLRVTIVIQLVWLPYEEQALEYRETVR